jgi:peroxiredoxin
MIHEVNGEVTAPDFELFDTHGDSVRLSDFRNEKPVLLVLTRGFV